ncbi:hypothetical protein CEXT_643381, partial [Caerostris extrusa]
RFRRPVTLSPMFIRPKSGMRPAVVALKEAAKWLSQTQARSWRWHEMLQGLESVPDAKMTAYSLTTICLWGHGYLEDRQTRLTFIAQNSLHYEKCSRQLSIAFG